MRRLAWFSLFAAVLVLVVSAGGWKIVRPGESIVVRRFGRIVEPAWGPGGHWGLPLGLDRFDRVRTDEVRLLDLGSDAVLSSGSDPAGAEVLTGDLNLVRVRAIVQYRVADPAEFVLHQEVAPELLQRLGEAALAGALARLGIDAVLRLERASITADVEHAMREAVERHRLGAAILGVSLVESRPPGEVAPDFAAAQAAESQRDRRIQDAQSRAETTEMAARAAAVATLERARADAHRRQAEAAAGADRFRALLAQARPAPGLTRRRLYTETLEALLARVRRKLVIPGGNAVDLTVLGVEP